jgi:hypothetical protein
MRSSCRVAYLRTTLAAELSIDGQQLKNLNEIFQATVPSQPGNSEFHQHAEADGSETTDTAGAVTVENAVVPMDTDPKGSAQAEPPISTLPCAQTKPPASG